MTVLDFKENSYYAKNRVNEAFLESKLILILSETDFCINISLITTRHIRLLFFGINVLLSELIFARKYTVHPQLPQ